MEGDVITLQDLFRFDYRAGIDDDGRFLGSLHPDRPAAHVQRPPGRRRHRAAGRRSSVRRVARRAGGQS